MANESKLRSDVDRYVQEVDDHLLGVPWRQRAQMRQELRQHLMEQGLEDGVDAKEYAEELLVGRENSTRLRFNGLASIWPTPREWVESGLRGIALYLVAAVAGSLVANLGRRLGDGLYSSLGLGETVWRSITQVLPVPAYSGSERSGLVVLALAWVVGQLFTGYLLERRPALRGRLRRTSYLLWGWLAVVAVVAVVARVNGT